MEVSINPINHLNHVNRNTFHTILFVFHVFLIISMKGDSDLRLSVYEILGEMCPQLKINK